MAHSARTLNAFPRCRGRAARITLTLGALLLALLPVLHSIPGFTHPDHQGSHHHQGAAPAGDDCPICQLASQPYLGVTPAAIHHALAPTLLSTRTHSLTTPAARRAQAIPRAPPHTA